MRALRLYSIALALVLSTAVAASAAAGKVEAGGAATADISGTNGPDSLTGTPGNDRMDGLMGDDRLAGLAGDDVIVGGGGVDRIDAGDGNDVISVLDGVVDAVTCGPGQDRVIVDRADSLAGDCEQVVSSGTVPEAGSGAPSTGTPSTQAPSIPAPPPVSSPPAAAPQNPSTPPPNGAGPAPLPISPPPPSGSRSVVLVDQQWRCTGVVDLDLVKVTMRVAGDAVSIGRGCSGWVGRIEVDTWTDDGVKVQNASPVAQGLVIGGGYVECHAALPGSHQDGVQAMGGSTLTMRNLTVDCLGNSNFFVARGGAGASAPTDVVCDGCVFGPRSASTVFIGPSLRSGVRNSVVCQGRYFDLRLLGPSEPVTSGTVVIPRTDPRCA